MAIAQEPDTPYAVRQFNIHDWLQINIGGVDASFTNSAAAMLVTVLLIGSYTFLAMRRAQLVPGRLQASVEIVHNLVFKTLIDTAGSAGRQHLPFVFAMFCFVFFGTLIGLTPVKFTFTSHIVVTIGLALIVFLYVVGIGLRQHGAHFFKSFMPDGTPLWLAPLIIPIEIISYLFRPVTLGVRLFANILAGHMIIKLFGDFCEMIIYNFGNYGYLLTVLPILMMILFYAVEVVIVFIQSYIFMLLTCIYIRSSNEIH
jgi:F-type H+-transporting ATPase subunit a